MAGKKCRANKNKKLAIISEIQRSSTALTSEALQQHSYRKRKHTLNCISPKEKLVDKLILREPSSGSSIKNGENSLWYRKQQIPERFGIF